MGVGTRANESMRGPIPANSKGPRRNRSSTCQVGGHRRLVVDSYYLRFRDAVVCMDDPRVRPFCERAKTRNVSARSTFCCLQRAAWCVALIIAHIAKVASQGFEGVTFMIDFGARADAHATEDR
jgi:hypothetical protein